MMNIHELGMQPDQRLAHYLAEELKQKFKGDRPLPTSIAICTGNPNKAALAGIMGFGTHISSHREKRLWSIGVSGADYDVTGGIFSTPGGGTFIEQNSYEGIDEALQHQPLTEALIAKMPDVRKLPPYEGFLVNDTTCAKLLCPDPDKTTRYRYLFNNDYPWDTRFKHLREIITNPQRYRLLMLNCSQIQWMDENQRLIYMQILFATTYHQNERFTSFINTQTPDTDLPIGIDLANIPEELIDGVYMRITAPPLKVFNQNVTIPDDLRGRSAESIKQLSHGISPLLLKVLKLIQGMKPYDQYMGDGI
ncbi:MAG: hypothetical protein U0525_00535 [Patescibacteria group bacterium]